MSDISLRITESLDLDTVLKEVVDRARSPTGTPGVALGLCFRRGAARMISGPEDVAGLGLWRLAGSLILI